MSMKDYRVVVVGTDGSPLAAPTVARAAWIAARDEADLVIVCVWSELSRRDDAKAMAHLGGDARIGEVLGWQSASQAVAEAVAVAQEHGATISAALMAQGEPATVLVQLALERKADLLVVGAIQDTSVTGRLLGTVAGDVVRKAPCDVLIVRPEELAVLTGAIPVITPPES